MASEKLANCPLCGGRRLMLRSDINSHMPPPLNQWYCSPCGIAAERGHGEDGAAAKWNALAEMAAKAATYDRFRAECEGSCRVSKDVDEVDALYAEERARRGLT